MGRLARGKTGLGVTSHQDRPYVPRTVDYQLRALLGSHGAVLIEGPRGCGKTETGSQLARSVLNLSSQVARQQAEVSAERVLQGEVPRLVDEWQLMPELWNEIRHEIDSRRAFGQFILSGSSTPSDDTSRHSGAGRIARVRMRPLALGEKYYHEAVVTLEDLRGGAPLPLGEGHLSYEQLASEAVMGGWPALLGQPPEAGQHLARGYVENLTRVELVEAGAEFDPFRVGRVIRSVARNVASEATLASITSDVIADGAQITPPTVRKYLDALTRVFVLEELPAWSGSLRSRTRLRQQAKLHFTDPSIACAALLTHAPQLADDPEFFGQVFESMAIRDLRTYSEQIRADLFGYRDAVGLEVDAILEFAEGGWAGIEIKLGENPAAVAAAEKNLLRLASDRIARRAEFLAVITGGRALFTLPSGVHVIPLSALRPLR